MPPPISGQVGAERPIIIKRRKRGGHDGHHGGAWKVAYADFVTAMWAFFILLWLLNTITSEQRRGIADYFAPMAVSHETSGAGGMLGGQTITVPGAQVSPSSPMSMDTPPSMSQGQTTEEGEEKGEEDAKPQLEAQTSDETPRAYQERLEQAAKLLGVPGQHRGESINAFSERLKGVETIAQERIEEARLFQRAAAEIRQAMQSIPELAPISESMMFDQTREGLRIQITDAERVSMFPSGSAQMYPQTRQVISALASVLVKLPNKIEITGHTDAVAFAPSSGIDNWSLSFDRANATKRVLVAGGLSETQIQDVSGRADRDLLVPDQPNSPRNRRITIVILRKAPAEPSE